MNNSNLLFRMKDGVEVANAVAQSIPDYIINGTGMICDPAMGGGQFLQAIIDRVGYNGIIPRLCGAETSTLHINWARRNTQLSNISKVNSYTIPMKVDAIVSNFPFSDRSVVNGNDGGGKAIDIDSHLYMESIKQARYVSAILRSKHFANETSRFRRELFSTGKVVSMVVLSEDVFPTILNTETCIVTWDERHTGPTKITYSDGTVVERVLDKDTVIKFNNPDYVSSVPNNMADRWMCGSLARNLIVDSEDGIEIVEIMGRKTSPVITRTIDESLTQTGCNTHGVIMNLNGNWDGFGKISIKPYESAISKQIIMIKTSSYEESKRMLEYLSSETVAEKVKTLKRSFCNSKYLFKMIEDLPNA